MYCQSKVFKLLLLDEAKISTNAIYSPGCFLQQIRQAEDAVAKKKSNPTYLEKTVNKSEIQYSLMSVTKHRQVNSEHCTIKCQISHLTAGMSIYFKQYQARTVDSLSSESLSGTLTDCGDYPNSGTLKVDGNKK
jgi:hypothetical protein